MLPCVLVSKDRCTSGVQPFVAVGVVEVPVFTLRHNTVSEDVDECALGCSEGTGGFDAVVSRRLNNSGSVLKAPHEAKGFIIFPSAEAISL